jgi:hypothetical protein
MYRLALQNDDQSPQLLKEHDHAPAHSRLVQSAWRLRSPALHVDAWPIRNHLCRVKPMSKMNTSIRSTSALIKALSAFPATTTWCPLASSSEQRDWAASRLSSTIITRRLLAGCSDMPSCALGNGSGLTCICRGSPIVKVLPRPIPLLLASTHPSCKVVSLFTRARPSLNPPFPLATAKAPWKPWQKLVTTI